MLLPSVSYLLTYSNARFACWKIYANTALRKVVSYFVQEKTEEKIHSGFICDWVLKTCFFSLFYLFQLLFAALEKHSQVLLRRTKLSANCEFVLFRFPYLEGKTRIRISEIITAERKNITGWKSNTYLTQFLIILKYWNILTARSDQIET